VNEKELRDITLGRVTPISIYICKKGELEQRQAEMVGINMRKLEERMEIEKKRLQKELDKLKQNNDYLNVRYGEIKDSLDMISKNIDKAFERIKEYAQNMALENLDNKDNSYIKAYDCFSRGELDSVSFYLQAQELELKHQKILQLQEEAKKEKALAEMLTESAKAKEEYSENSLNELIKEWMLLAQTAAIQFKYEEAEGYYIKMVEANPLNVDHIFEFAKYLYSIREFAKAENYFLQCLERYRALEKENPDIYLYDVANTLHHLAIVHQILNEYSKAAEEFEEALEIRKKLAAGNPKKYSGDMANTLNNLGRLHQDHKEYLKALKLYEEALEIFGKFTAENQKAYFSDIANTLNNMGNLHTATNEYPKASEEFEEALEIFRELVAENSKIYIADMTRVLNNLAILHCMTHEYPKALEEYQEVLEINRELAAENPKLYLFDVAHTLSNLTLLHLTLNEYTMALEECEEALEIHRTLAVENPKVYLTRVAWTLNILAYLHQNIKEYQKALETDEEALEIYREFAVENPKVYLADVTRVLNNLAAYSLFAREYAKSEQYAREALTLAPEEWATYKVNLAHSLLFQGNFLEAEEIYKELLQNDAEARHATSLQLLNDFDELEKAGAIPEERKDDVGRIREILEE